MNGLPPSRLSMDGFAPPPPPPSSSSSSAPRITLFSSRVNSAAKSNGNDNANGNGNGSSRVETMQRDDTTDSGSESDGDPPGFVGQAPPPPIAPRPVLPKRESSSGGGSNSSSGGGVGSLVTKEQPPATTTTRSFEELEDIAFSSPRSFLAMALQIAQSRGVDLLVDRDNTDTAFRYMHVVCPYRHTGPCPFILKLRAPIEGGWIVTGPPPAGTTQDRATGLNDARGPSTFECKHPPRAMPRDFRPGETVARWLERDTIWARGSAELAEKRDVRRASTPQAHAQGGGSGSGSATKSLSSGRVLRSSATDGLKQVDSVAGKAPRFPRSAHHVNHSPLNGGGRNGGRDSTASPIASRTSAAAAPASPRSGQSPIQSVPAPSRPAATTTTMDTDRALAPPFQRALDLQAQIAPALGHGAAAGTTTSLSVNGSAPSSSRPKGANPYPPMTFALPPPAPAAGVSAAASTVTATAAPASLAANGSVVPGKVPASSTGSGFAPPPPPRPGSSTSSSERRPNATGPPTSALPPPAPLAPPVFPSLRPASWGVSPPCIAQSTSSAIDEWTTFLRDYLGEAELVPLARVLGSAYMSVKPCEFFSPSRGDDEDLRRATLEAIPVEAVGVWPKLRLVKAMRERGQAAWDRWLASKAASSSMGDSTMHGV